jgi:hypothetical protein
VPQTHKLTATRTTTMFALTVPQPGCVDPRNTGWTRIDMPSDNSPGGLQSERPIWRGFRETGSHFLFAHCIHTHEDDFRVGGRRRVRAFLNVADPPSLPLSGLLRSQRDFTCPITAASSTGRCNTIQRVGSTLFPRGIHPFGCVGSKASHAAFRRV